MTPTIDGIIRAVAQHRGFTPEDITGRARGIHGKTTAARNMAFWLAREVAKGKLEDIAVEFDHRDHSSVVYGIQCHEKAMASNGHVRRATEFLAMRCRRDMMIRDMIRRGFTAKDAAPVLGISEQRARGEARRLGVTWRGMAIAAKRRMESPRHRQQAVSSLLRRRHNAFHDNNLHLLSKAQLEDYRTLRAAKMRRVEAAQAIGRTDILRPEELATIHREAA